MSIKGYAQIKDPQIKETAVTAWRERVAELRKRVTLPDLTPDPKHDGIGIEWFTDTDHLLRFQRWLDPSDRVPG